jgi:hypothetical protein
VVEVIIKRCQVFHPKLFSIFLIFVLLMAARKGMFHLKTNRFISKKNSTLLPKPVKFKIGSFVSEVQRETWITSSKKRGPMSANSLFKKKFFERRFSMVICYFLLLVLLQYFKFNSILSYKCIRKPLKHVRRYSEVLLTSLVL